MCCHSPIIWKALAWEGIFVSLYTCLEKKMQVLLRVPLVALPRAMHGPVADEPGAASVALSIGDRTPWTDFVPKSLDAWNRYPSQGVGVARLAMVMT